MNKRYIQKAIAIIFLASVSLYLGASQHPQSFEISSSHSLSLSQQSSHPNADDAHLNFNAIMAAAERRLQEINTDRERTVRRLKKICLYRIGIGTFFTAAETVITTLLLTDNLDPITDDTKTLSVILNATVGIGFALYTAYWIKQYRSLSH